MAWKREDVLLLAHVPGMGSARIRKVLLRWSCLRELLRESADVIRAAGLPAELLANIKQCSALGVKRDLSWCESPQNHLLTILDVAYPEWLKEIPSPPMVLWVKGDPAVLQRKQLAIVGSRHPTPSAEKIAYQFAKQISEVGWVVASGLAMGIDAAAHWGAVSIQAPTVAVLANGLNSVYPRRNDRLAQAIVDAGGCLVSESSLDTVAQANLFPRRNRIISGLSRGVLVVEASLKSGSLRTAQYALDQGREVFAVPGSIYNPMAKGTNALLRQGAKLVESLEDILQEFDENFWASIARCTSDQVIEFDEQYSLLLEAIGYDPVSVDELVVRTTLTTDNICSMLLVLELKNVIKSSAGGVYFRLP